MSRKKIIIIFVICILLLAIIIFTVLASRSQKPTVTNSASSQTSSTSQLQINGLGDQKYNIPPSSQTAIVSRIEMYLTKANISIKNIKGEVRSNSYSENVVYDSTVKTFLVDIPQIKRTYKASISVANNENGDNALYIICPSTDELIYGPFKCEDDLGNGN